MLTNLVHFRLKRKHLVLYIYRYCLKIFEDRNFDHWRIQEFILEGPNQGPQSKVKGEARVEGAKCPRIEGEAQTEGEARGKAGEGSGEGARWAPPQKNFEKSNLKPFILVHIWSNSLKWLYIERNGLIAHFHEKSLVIIWCDGIIKFCWSIKLDRGSEGRSPPEAKTL